MARPEGVAVPVRVTLPAKSKVLVRITLADIPS